MSWHHRPISIRDEGTRDLVRRYGDTGDEAAWDELRRRGVLRSRAANPCGDYAEYLVARHYGVELEPPSTAGFDLRTPEGERVQVRGRHVKTRQPSYYRVSRDLLNRNYDKLALVFFERDYFVEWSVAIPFQDLLRLAVKYENTEYRLRLPGTWRDDPAVENLGRLDPSSAGGGF